MKDPVKLVRRRIRELSAYHVEPRPCEVVLDANESPHPLPGPLRPKIEAALKIELNRYPDPEAKALKKAIAAKEGVREDEILLGNGSDEVIQALIASVCDPGDKILVPAPTFTMYKLIARYLNADTIEVPLLDDWSLDISAVIHNMKFGAPKIIFIASPNNPTGAMANREALDAVVDAAPGLVAVDEAYIDYAKAPAGPLFRERKNVVILRTLSKIGLAGIRLGYMMADAALIEQVNKVRLPYNINSMVQAIARIAVENWREFLPALGSIVKERGRVFEELSRMGGVHPFPSEANFILIRIEERSAGEIFERLLSEGVRVRWFEGDPRLGDCLRGAIGTPEENGRFLAALKKALS
ncbi:MAG: histidinol-phosphate transaminase [Candidatus Nitrospinota bacterium M3_3B_026]